MSYFYSWRPYISVGEKRLQAERELNQIRASGDDGVFLRDVLLGVEARLGHRVEAQLLADSLLESTRHDAWQFPREEETVARAWVAFNDFDRAIPLLEHALSVPAVEATTPAYLRLVVEFPDAEPLRGRATIIPLPAKPRRMGNESSR